MFPLTDGNYLMIKINGDWVDELSLAGEVFWSAQPPGFSYPSDTNGVSPGVYLSVDHTNPGAVRKRWTSRPSPSRCRTATCS